MGIGMRRDLTYGRIVHGVWWWEVAEPVAECGGGVGVGVGEKRRRR